MIKCILTCTRMSYWQHDLALALPSPHVFLPAKVALYLCSPSTTFPHPTLPTSTRLLIQQGGNMTQADSEAAEVPKARLTHTNHKEYIWRDITLGVRLDEHLHSSQPLKLSNREV